MSLFISLALQRESERIRFSYVPYKYAMEKFVHLGSIQKDHIDPSIFCVLTAKSKTPGAPLADFLIFSGRWDVATGTFRPPVSQRLLATD